MKYFGELKGGTNILKVHGGSKSFFSYSTSDRCDPPGTTALNNVIKLSVCLTVQYINACETILLL